MSEVPLYVRPSVLRHDRGVVHAHQFHVETLIIHKLGFNQNYYTFALILLIKIVLCSKFPGTKFINYKLFEMKFGEPGLFSAPESPALFRTPQHVNLRIV